MPRFDRTRWEQLRPLLDAALDLEPGARAQWLVEQRRLHPALADELEELLRREARIEAEGFLDPAREPALAGMPSTLAGQVLGPWVLERPLGQGGMGSVWLARRQDGRYEGTAAIKFLSLALAGPEGEARFRREGSVLARLDHPNIARLFDAGVSATGQPFLVLEHVDGVPIDVWCDRRRTGIPGRIRLFQQVLAAVANAHSHLIVHRDLKPANILVTEDGSVKLLDFGIARLLQDGEDAGVTGGRDRMLTFDYAAPEQIRGDPVSMATDVYALGVILYGLLAGRHPTNAGCVTLADRVRAILDQDPLRLTRALTPGGPVTRDETERAAAARGIPLERLRRLCAGDLENILARALEKDPARRYPTVEALNADLDRYLEHRPVAARRATWGYRTGKFLRRNRGGVLSALLVGLTLIGATVITALQAREARRQRDAALYQSERADAQIDFQRLLLSELGDQPMTMREILDGGRDLLLAQYAGQPRFLASLLVDLSRRYLELGDRAAQAELLARADSIAATVNAPELLAVVRCNEAERYRIEGEYEEAWRKLDAGDSLLRLHPDPTNRVACLAIRSQLAFETHRPVQGTAAIRAALAIEDSLGRTRSSQYLELLGWLATSLEQEGRPREGLAVYQQALRVMDSTGRGQSLPRIIMQHDMALTMLVLGETAGAEALLHDVLVRVARTDTSGWIEWQPLIHYAETALAQDHADSARKYFEKIVRQAEDSRTLYWEGRGLFGLARAQIRLGDLKAARATRNRFDAVARALPKVTVTDDQVPDVRVLDGMLHLATGDTLAARNELLAALESNGFHAGRDLERLRPVALLAAEAALATGDPATALRLARVADSLALVDSTALGLSARVGESRLVLARIYLATGDTSAARTAAGIAAAALAAGAGPAGTLARRARQLADSLASGRAARRAALSGSAPRFRSTS